MIPFGHHVVTLLHRNGMTYDRHVLSGCSWYGINERTLVDGATVITVRTTCRIPPQFICPVPGDLLVLGNYDIGADNDIALVRLMEQLRSEGFRAFRVESCADNTNGVPLPHYAATGV